VRWENEVPFDCLYYSPGAHAGQEVMYDIADSGISELLLTKLNGIVSDLE